MEQKLGSVTVYDEKFQHQSHFEVFIVFSEVADVNYPNVFHIRLWMFITVYTAILGSRIKPLRMIRTWERSYLPGTQKPK